MVTKEYSTKKDLEILFSWLIFYRNNKQVKEYQTCQQQIDNLLPKFKHIYKS